MKTNPDAPASPNHGFASDASGALCNTFVSDPGLTKREHFAALAMQGLLCSCVRPLSDSNDANQIASASVMAAEALIRMLNK